jgi:threonine synthase
VPVARWWCRAAPRSGGDGRGPILAGRLRLHHGRHHRDRGALIARVAPALGWFDLATLKEPYRLEGKKTMGLELAEQLDWDTPDVLVYPTGGGTGLVGIWKAYEELATMGWVKAPRRASSPVQAVGCAPVVKAWEDKARDHDPCGESVDARARAARAGDRSRAGRCCGSCASPAAPRRPWRGRDH